MIRARYIALKVQVYFHSKSQHIKSTDQSERHSKSAKLDFCSLPFHFDTQSKSLNCGIPDTYWTLQYTVSHYRYTTLLSSTSWIWCLLNYSQLTPTHAYSMNREFWLVGLPCRQFEQLLVSMLIASMQLLKCCHSWNCHLT